MVITAEQFESSHPAKPILKTYSRKFLGWIVGRAFIVVAFGIVLGRISTAMAEEPPSEKCDHAAARKVGAAATATGMSFEQLDARKAISACKSAVLVDPKNGRLLFELGRGYEKARRYADALDFYGQAAALGYAPAYASIGNMYSLGRGAEKDKRRAFEWFRNAAEAGDLVGQFALGQVYENARGVEQDYTEALKWYKKAAEQGLAEGQDSVGYFYSAGLGVARNDNEAVSWMRKAAEQGLRLRKTTSQ